MFADDTNLFISGVDMDHMQNLLNYGLHHISQWLIAHKLFLSVEKITKTRIARNIMTIKINGQVINEVSKTKLLGLIFDNTIIWEDHISYIAGKVPRGIGMILKTRKYLQKALLTL